MALRTVHYEIPLPPQAWARAKMCGKRFYDGQINDKITCGLFMSKQHGFNPPLDRPLSLDVTFYMGMSVKTKKKGTYYHSHIPDLDNLLKFLLDTACQAEIIKDDRLITTITARKIYSDNPRTVFTLTEMA